MPPIGRLDVSMPVEVERAPYPSDIPGFPPQAPTPASHRCSVRTLLATTHSRRYRPTPQNVTVSKQYIVLKNHSGREILAPVAYVKVF
jgi:hypothetical protein